ncbi:hypothetical protein N7447_009155 [Penicillium robsamsonii]|uniref:uncharacterized protein n=1 Tax=Penicillium robsamsonii TaxID=1792511 RepID=UPI002549BEC5|nr:uncharacterized protein N7447_009155 [Penicillium robsamsonii]KAJ5816922.1 hypothetical protein N7447_009155 [Penicillium robsamsonii]
MAGSHSHAATDDKGCLEVEWFIMAPSTYFMLMVHTISDSYVNASFVGGVCQYWSDMEDGWDHT